MATGGGDGRESLFSKSASQLHAELAARDPEAAAQLQESLDNATASAAARVQGAVESPLGTASAEATDASQSAVGNVTRLLGGVERAAKINPALLPEDTGSGGADSAVASTLSQLRRGGDARPTAEAFDALIRQAQLEEGFGAQEVGGATERTAAGLEDFKDSIADAGRPESWASTAFKNVKKLGRFFDRRLGTKFGAVQPLQVREGQLIVNPDSVLGETLGPRTLSAFPEVPDREPSVEREVPTELETMIPEERARFLRPTEAPEQPLTAAPQAELVAPPDRLSELRTDGSVDRSGALARIERGVALRRAQGRSVPIETESFGDVKRNYLRTRGRSTTVKRLRRTETDFPEAPEPEAPVRSGPITTAAQADALFASDDEEDEDAPAPKPRALKEDTSGIWKEDGLNEPDDGFDLEGFQRNEANRIANAKSALDRDFPENMFDEDDEEEEEEAAPAAAAEQAEPRGITDDDIFDMNFDGESKVGEVDAPNVVRGGGSAQDTQTITRTAPEDTTGYAETGAADDIEAATPGFAADTAATRADTGSTLLSNLKDPVASSGAATADEVIEGAATGFAAEQVAGGLEGIDAIPVIGDIAGVVAGLGGALAVEFMNKPQASPVEHIKSVVNVASQFGASQ